MVWPFNSKITGNPSSYSFLITGCDTGFGNLTARKLALQGFHVYAGCLTDNGISDLKRLNLTNLIACKLDITKQDQVDSVVDRIKREVGNLFCLINNAGLQAGSLVELTSMDQFELIFAVNFFGAIRCSKACIPLLREYGGGARIINISSAASFGAAPMMSGYCASKVAIRYFGDSLRQEMQPFGIYVTSVCPGFFKTPILDSVGRAKSDFAKVPKEIQSVYGEDFVLGFVEKFQNRAKSMPDPSICVDQIVHCALAKSPPATHTVGYDSFFIWYVVYYVPMFIQRFLISLYGTFFLWGKLAWKNKQKIQ
ncbi:hypothetical protein BC833DRAFT_526166 [Globomyces pollinis-pini]|nr:hypothetical protein BC833DRAFT_526166 [Globomyces pollinis-pini]KAJ2990621.1 Retinol dehydrogenase 5 [Globomyces sp. JEL0801]